MSLNSPPRMMGSVTLRCACTSRGRPPPPKKKDLNHEFKSCSSIKSIHVSISTVAEEPVTTESREGHETLAEPSHFTTVCRSLWEVHFSWNYYIYIYKYISSVYNTAKVEYLLCGSLGSQMQKWQSKWSLANMLLGEGQCACAAGTLPVVDGRRSRGCLYL